MSAGGGGDGHGTPKADINTTPLVDVMLVLLIIFMITAPLMQNKVQVTLPTADSEKEEQSAEQKPRVTLSIVVKNGRPVYYWEEQVVTLETLAARMKGEAQRTRNKIQMKIRADRTAKYEDISAVLKLARNNGVGDVSFISSPTPKG
jgi:biopolymer transport protein ExbD